jgi:hypothetical protein
VHLGGDLLATRGRLSPVSTSAVEPFRSGRLSVKWRAGCSEVMNESRQLVQYCRGTGHRRVVGTCKQLHFLAALCRVGGGRFGDIEAKNVFESVQ